MQDQTIVMTWPDHTRLTALVENQRRNKNGRDDLAFGKLAAELARASLVASADIPPDIVTMNSTARVRDLDSGETFAVTVSWPEGADTSRGRINVLAPLGMALLGCRVGQQLQWPVPSGIRRLKIDSIVFQPENASEPEAC